MLGMLYIIEFIVLWYTIGIQYIATKEENLFQFGKSNNITKKPKVKSIIQEMLISPFLLICCDYK